MGIFVIIHPESGVLLDFKEGERVACCGNFDLCVWGVSSIVLLKPFENEHLVKPNLQ